LGRAGQTLNKDEKSCEKNKNVDKDYLGNHQHVFLIPRLEATRREKRDICSYCTLQDEKE
jgi:hypothetical protein